MNLRMLRKILSKNGATGALTFTDANFAFTPSMLFGLFTSGLAKWMTSFAEFLPCVNRRNRIAPQKIFSRSSRFQMPWVYTGLVVALMVEMFSFGNCTYAKEISNAIGANVVRPEPESRSAIGIKSPCPTPAFVSVLYNFFPESFCVSDSEFEFHEVRILSNWLEPCDGNKAEGHLSHRERLNERTPKGDAIVRSHGNKNHERPFYGLSFADAREITICYGAIQEQVSTLPAVMNLLGDGSKFGKPINNVGIRGYVFLARVAPNWNLGFRPEGTTGVGAAGNQGLANSTVTLRYGYVPITITGQAENLTKGESRAFMQAKALEAKFDMKDMVSHVNVLVIGAEPGGQLAQVAAPVAGSFTADNTGLLPGAIYLRNGQPIDTIPVGGGAPSILNSKITAINYTTRVVTVPGTAIAGHAVALTGEYPQVAIVNDGWFAPNGFQNLVNSSGVVQGIDPGVNAAWQSYLFDNGAAALSSQLLQQLRQFVKNRGGVDPNIFIVPSAQINQYVGIATTTLRFDITNEGPAAKVGKKALDLGFNVFDYAGLPMVEDKDARPDRIYTGDTEMMKKFEAIPLSLAEDEAGTWTRIVGANGVADAVIGLLRWYVNIGLLQRSAWGRLQNLLVPANFATAPPTI